MPSISASLATISKTSLTSIDESIQTSFHGEPSTSSPDKNKNNEDDEKFDVVDEDVSVNCFQFCL